MIGFAALVDDAGSNEAFGLPILSDCPVGRRMLLDPEGGTVDERRSRTRAGRRRDPFRRRPGRRPSGQRPDRPAKGEVCASLQKGCPAAGGQDRDRRYRLGDDLGKRCRRAVQRRAASGSDRREVGGRAARPGVAATGVAATGVAAARANSASSAGQPKRAAHRRSNGRMPVRSFRSRRPPGGGLLRSLTRRSERMGRSAYPMPGASRRPADCRRRCSKRSRRDWPKRRSGRRSW